MFAVNLKSWELSNFNMENITVRKATDKDLDSVLILFYKLSISDSPYDEDVDLDWGNTDGGKKYFKEKINGTNGVCFVAIMENKIVGYFTANKKEVPGYRLITVADLENLVVDENSRSKGIDKMLMDKFLSWAKGIGAKRASVNVFSGNSKGIAFYSREGFTLFETTLEKELE